MYPFWNDLLTLSRRSVKELGIYILVSALIIATVFALVLNGIDLKWVALIGFSVAVFWSPVQTRIRFARQGRFWIFLSLVSVVHFAVWATILLRIQHWKVIWFYPMIFEVAIFIALANWLFASRHRRL